MTCLDGKSKPRASKGPGCRSSCSQGIARSWTSHRNIAKGKCQQKVQPSSALGQVKLISTSTTECRRGAHLLSHCCINGHMVPGRLLQPLRPCASGSVCWCPLLPPEHAVPSFTRGTHAPAACSTVPTQCQGD